MMDFIIPDHSRQIKPNQTKRNQITDRSLLINYSNRFLNSTIITAQQKQQPTNNIDKAAAVVIQRSYRLRRSPVKVRRRKRREAAAAAAAERQRQAEGLSEQLRRTNAAKTIQRAVRRRQKERRFALLRTSWFGLPITRSPLFAN